MRLANAMQTGEIQSNEECALESLNFKSDGCGSPAIEPFPDFGACVAGGLVCFIASAGFRRSAADHRIGRGFALRRGGVARPA
jgi:hypothetical protein